MIRIDKSIPPPTILRTRGRQATLALCSAYERGERTFDFDRKLFAADSVKTVLQQAQHNKCAFCESKFVHVGYGDVEHFRPKSGFQQRASDTLVRPGYYWLAYEWSNLFFSCQLCNQSFKRNLFPLEKSRRRARSHRDNLRAERPLLLDPSAVDPATVLSFRGEIAFAINGNRVGQTTIDVLGLNRSELLEARRDRYEIIQVLLRARSRFLATPSSPGLRADLAQLNAKLAKMTHESAEYAAMARAACAALSPP